MKSKCGREREESRSLYIAILLFPECSIPSLTVTIFPFYSHLNLLESPKPKQNGSIKSGIPLFVSVQPASLLGKWIHSLINFRCLLLDYLANSLIILMLSKFLCLAKKIKNVTILYLVLVFPLHLLSSHIILL